MIKVDEKLQEKYKKLENKLASYGKVAVAYSAGVDSTFLLYAAREALGEKAIALTAVLNSVPKKELAEAQDFCKAQGIQHYLVQANELEVEGFAENPVDRCYICKRAIFQKFVAKAKELDINLVVEGSNLDDQGDYRPGRKALGELGIQSPLLEAGLTKEDIRALSQKFGLPTWDKPSYACLSSRIPYGELITKEKLELVDRSEAYLRELGFGQLRVRVHGNLARIELLQEDFNKMMEKSMRKSVHEKLKEFGFSYVSVDLLGFRSGSLNEVLEFDPK